MSDDRDAMRIDPNPPGVTLRPFTPAEMAALDEGLTPAELAAIDAADPYPVGSTVTVLDHDGETVHGPFQVVRSYWPSTCVELLLSEAETGRPYMCRQSHDRIIGIVSAEDRRRARAAKAAGID